MRDFFAYVVVSFINPLIVDDYFIFHFSIPFLAYRDRECRKALPRARPDALFILA